MAKITKQEDTQKLTELVLANANVARKAVLLAETQIAKAVEESPFNNAEVEPLLKFAKMFMSGTDQGMIFDCYGRHLDKKH